MTNENPTYEFSVVYDGEETLEEVMTQLIVGKILGQIKKEGLPKREQNGYNIPVPSNDVSGSCDEAS